MRISLPRTITAVAPIRRYRSAPTGLQAQDLAVAATNARETDAIHLVLIYNCCLYKSALLAAHRVRRRFS